MTMVHLEAEMPQRPVLRCPGWLMAWSPLLSIAWVAAVVTTMSGSGVQLAADLTREQMDAIRVGWTVQWLLYAVSVVFGSIGMVLLNNALRKLPGQKFAAAAQVAVAVSVLAVLATFVLRMVAAGFTTERLGGSGAYDASMVASYLAAWAAFVAVILTGVSLRVNGVLRRTGLIVAIIASVFLVLDLVTRAPPPWLAAFYWLAFGIGLLRRRVPSLA
jgi:hypothetical protein